MLYFPFSAVKGGQSAILYFVQSSSLTPAASRSAAEVPVLASFVLTL